MTVGGNRAGGGGRRAPGTQALHEESSGPTRGGWAAKAGHPDAAGWAPTVQERIGPSWR
ncbi:hypothetical protein MOPEL_007_00830 [Mobilicoccus pelagius NBRC 104925]|uniref:Uncharacterized protein n=1 Tax=Mobilicoccus pelagius NBRC 104925 TaxID=1089455 RepID=H5UNF9_9MICO|nr:hypothetical protein MOPEL_007_00830 [Mobilicoccus pelagius NBRC 104925]